ncbi:MAG: sugar kinase [Caldilineaceae bacterium]
MTTPRFDVTAIGEVMLRYSVPVGERLERAQQLLLHPGGAEANLLAALACLERRCAWVSGLPENPLGRLIANHLRLGNVDTAAIYWSPQGRVGAYYLEFATPPRATQVYYDRADSVTAQLTPEQINWDHLLDTRLLHLTGITPALSPSCLAVTQEAIRRAKQAGVALSFDINYRAKLWSEARAAEVLLPMIQDIDILFCGQGDAQRVFGCSGGPQDIVKRLGEISHAQCVVTSLADEGVLIWDGKEFYRAAAHPVQIVDRLGAGDALAAGVIHGWLDGDLAKGAQYGTLLAAICLTLHGDTVVTTRAEVEALLKSSGGGLNR